MSDKKRNVPVLRFNGFSDAWEQRKLGDMGKTFAGLSGKTKEDFGHGNAKYVTYMNVFSNPVSNHKMVESVEIDTKQQQVQYGDVFFTTSSETPEEVGMSSVWLENIKNVYLNSFCFGYRPTAIFAPYYLAFMLRSPILRKKFMLLAQGISRYNISKNKVMDIQVLIPALTEQKKIGAFFQHLDNTIALHQRKLDALKQMKKGFLQQLFPENGEKLPRVRFTGFQEEWEQRKLGDMGKTFAGLSGKTKEDFGHGNAKYVTYMNVFSNPVSNHKMVESVEIDTKQQQVQYGDVFFTTSSETPEEVGMSSVWLENIKNVYLNSFCFGYRPTAIFAPYYLAFMLRSPILRKKFMLLAQGISRYNISKNKVMDIQVLIPALTEQKKIGAFFQHLDNTIALYQYKLDQLNILKKACLQNMFI
ncbi:restriction endonuclease subunit S [Listeria booriae]|uniref:Restriction endonuclease subunit S n=1 Tax=Listeria booriae TaxID=1552123 RepID=A0A842CML1_9LIST|nr:restriction endonuclease subunit S [Listeria booriae]MBC2003095.1 restriction endonuclease subunit S [Listeria booriae]